MPGEVTGVKATEINVLVMGFYGASQNYSPGAGASYTQYTSIIIIMELTILMYSQNISYLTPPRQVLL